MLKMLKISSNKIIAQKDEKTTGQNQSILYQGLPIIYAVHPTVIRLFPKEPAG